MKKVKTSAYNQKTEKPHLITNNYKLQKEI
jgi:hypothetical protein